MTLNALIRTEWRQQNWDAAARRDVIRKLWNSFPCLRCKQTSAVPKLREFDGDFVLEQCSFWSTGEIHCALFVLSVWNPRLFGEHFKLSQAMQMLSGSTEARALADWCANPWWP